MALESLIAQRGQIKAKLTRFSTFLSKLELDASKLSELQFRIEKFESIWGEFDKVQSDIELQDPDDDQIEEREVFEDNYFALTARAKAFLAPNHSSRANPFMSQPPPSGNNIAKMEISLLQINLPEFNGAYDKWMQFYDTFRSLIHTNENLSNIQKLYYLQAELRGEAAQILASSLKTLNDSVKHWDIILIHLVANKLDNGSKREWETHSKNDPNRTIDSFIKFLSEKCQVLETLGNKTNIIANSQNKFDHKGINAFTHVSANKLGCFYCKGSRNIYSCKKFLALTPHARFTESKNLNICVNCLRLGHSVKDCILGPCRVCRKRHNTLLHFDSASGSASQPVSDVTMQTSSLQMDEASGSNTSNNLRASNNSSGSTDRNFISSTAEVSHCVHDAQLKQQVLLSTAIIFIQDSDGTFIECRVLLDSGSQSIFITRRLASKLRLNIHNINMPVSGITQSLVNIHGGTQTTVKSRYNDYMADLDFLIIENITGNIPQLSFDISSFKIPTNIQLADPEFNKSSPINILIGASIFFDLLCIGQIKNSRNGPTLQKSVLGWIISGNYLQACNSSCSFLSLNRSKVYQPLVSDNLEKQLEKFWVIEETSSDKVYTKDENDCETHFRENTTRDRNGRFVVSLPLRDNYTDLGNSQQIAINRFHTLEKKLSKNKVQKDQYDIFMEEYKLLGHMTQIEPKLPSNFPVYYLPHHYVFKESSTTSRLRVVFDASAKTSNNNSLNDVLKVGPTIQDDLFSILLRFRTHNYVLTADIAKMYRQILIEKNQRSLQRIVWRSDSANELKHFQLNTVTYGTASASFLATRCLKQIGLEVKQSHPKASHAILHDFYVDDFISGCSSISDAVRLKNDMETILASYGFQLRKWIANDPCILNDQLNNPSLTEYVITNTNNKTLGVIWDSKVDCFRYTNKSIKKGEDRVTKRTILSVIAQIFDPLGLLGPTIILAKIILQRLWQLKLQWDEAIPVELYTLWIQFQNRLNSINQIGVPRHVLVKDPVLIEIHGFSDASEKAYGACVYIRSKDISDNIFTALACAKSRVAPLKSISLPRLELCGSLLLAKLVNQARSALNLNVSRVFYWCDSTIVLSWLAAQPTSWKTFVCNRVSEIQQLSKIEEWNHVPSGDSPADIISRGKLPPDLLNSELWFNGPQWLSAEESGWPTASYEPPLEVPEAKPVSNVMLLSKDTVNIFNLYSTFTKLQRVVANILRFCKNMSVNRHSRITGSLTLDELSACTETLIRLAQKQEFNSELASLSGSNPLCKRSKLASLAPFLDGNGLIRVGGRLRFSALDYNQKHPILLPYNHPLTKLIILHEHLKNLHAGPQTILSSIRQNYWPINGRQAVRNVLRKCVVCFRAKPVDSNYQMGDLPASRISISRPFCNVGTDYAGRFQMKDGNLRNRRLVKCYICIFICLVTKAVHLEVVSDLTSNGFMNMLKRFVSRRELCKSILSDNGTNFVGANNELLKRPKCIEEAQFQSYLKSHQIVWKFIPPKSLHFGGVWESAVKSAKYHLKRVAHNVNLTYEEFYTLPTQIEAILNSRPLTPLSNDPNDLQPLTPGHFIIGEPLNAVPQHNVEEIQINCLSRYEHLQRMLQHFWSRWSKEYLHNLQQRSKWYTHSQTGADKLAGALVLLKEEHTHPLDWQLGRILQVHPEIERTHLGDLGYNADIEFVRPLKIDPVLHGYDILYDLQRNKHDKTILKHHSGHFRHKSAEVWDPHPQYEIKAFDRTLLLQLEQNREIVSPNFHIVSHIRDNHMQKIRHNPKMVGCFYHGKIKGDNESSVSVSLCDGMTGYIKTSDSNYYIEPAEKFSNDTLGSLKHRIKRLPHPPKDAYDDIVEPEEIWENSENSTIIEDEFPTAIVAHRPIHSISKREIIIDEETKVAYIDTCDIDTEKENAFYLDELSRTTRDTEWSSFAKTSNEYFVKVLVVADSSMIKYHVREDDLTHYILTLMSHVALLYKDATIGNAISIAVVQIGILRNDDFSISNSQDMLRKFCEWQQRNIWERKHDVSLLLTRNTICKNATATESCTTLGVAEVGSMCRASSCAIVRDKGLSTSYTIAHELGHVLSMPHDEDKKCDQFNKGFKQNNIMNKMLRNDTKPFMWSACSKYFVTEFLNSNRAKCLNNPPTKDYITSPYSKMLPGDKFEVDRQCELEFGPGSKICPFQPPCGHLWCTTDNGAEGCKTQWSPWAEGTSCGERSWCFQRKCIPENRQEFKPVDGGWGPWQDFGPCSRTCGGGIKVSKRNCDSPKPVNGGSYCTGESARYASCNTMDCDPGADDFRAVQCAAFNGVTKNLPNLTNGVEWVPKYGLKNPDDFCRLYCRPKNFNAYYLLKEKVLDGTKCGLTSFDICINGFCRPGGCDNKLESKIVVDHCGICGGSNNRCNQMTGMYNKSAESSGYSKVVTFPKGSSNINITQVPFGSYAVDENYLVLMDETETPVLNGNYIAVTHETDIVFGSLIITYSGTNSTVEWITTPKNHKLTKALQLWVLSVGKLTPPQITYRYVIGKDDAPSYGWRLYQKEWSKCNSICDGKQYRKPVCVDLATGSEVPNSRCDAMDESVIQTQECNTHCELTWNIASTGACSAPCGKGIRRVYYNCMRVYKKKPNYSEIVHEKHCSILAKPPALETCNTVCNSTRWDYSSWSECTKTCGSGVQRRTAKCVDNNYTPIDDSYCNNSEKITEQICNTERCPNWILADASSCSAPCGGGYRNITYYCVLDGRIYENACDMSLRPPIREACNEQDCGRWVPIDAYHMCSVTCGEGVERRQFVCKKFNSEDILDDIYCRNIPIPNESRVCYRGSCDKLSAYDRRRNFNNDFDNSIIPELYDKYQTFRWTPGEWSTCSQTCDGGTSTQTFHCINELGTKDELMCNPNLKPTNIIQCDNKPCPKWKTGDWSPNCDFNCERHRQVRCMDYTNNMLDDHHCDIFRRPEETTKCKLSECPHVTNTITRTYFDSKEKDDRRYRWKVGAWKQCTNTCGKGTRRRHIECEDVLNDITVVDSLCRHLRKPKATRPCERYNCKYAWIESYWSSCSTTCGPGVKTRNVTCHKVHHGGIMDPVPLPDIYLNKIHHKNYCSIYSKPSTTAKCLLSHCGDEYIWQTEPWRECTHKCGRKGRQVRIINCVNSRTKERVSRHMCRRNLKPPRKRKCNQWRCLYKNCKEIKQYMRTKENKDYVISIGGRPAQVYCYKMDTPEPQEYISLHPDTRNYAEIYDKRLINIQSCPYNGQRRDNCHCDQVGTERSGLTNFWKVRVNITSMKIIGDDFTFSKQIKGSQIPYGTAGDCYSSIRGCAQGRFSVNLTYTSFKLSRNVRWEEIGPNVSSEIHRTETGASGKCGGYCGNCIPDPSIGLAVEIT